MDVIVWEEEWDLVTYPFQNFNGCTVEIWEVTSNFFPCFIIGVITLKGPLSIKTSIMVSLIRRLKQAMNE